VDRGKLEIQMAKIKSENHHWWPKCVSRFWAAEDGTTGWAKPDGSIIRVPPAKLAMIGNGHHIKLDPNGGPTPWDSTFEREFDKADTAFPQVISWLEGLERRFVDGIPLSGRFVPQGASDDDLRSLTECVVSLAVRSPRNREASVALAEQLRGPLPEPERNSLIAANMQRSQRLIADSIGARGKFAVLFTSGREFLFGDGFFHNVIAAVNAPYGPKIVAPITPSITVVVSRPMQFSVEPRLSTIVLRDDEVELCNHAVQVYSRRALFFRNEAPLLHDVFTRSEHLCYSSEDNPLDRLIRGIPGVVSRSGFQNSDGFR
jgi:hypothetical protein